jgi:hypothetical protein
MTRCLNIHNRSPESIVLLVEKILLYLACFGFVFSLVIFLLVLNVNEFIGEAVYLDLIQEYEKNVKAWLIC